MKTIISSILVVLTATTVLFSCKKGESPAEEASTQASVNGSAEAEASTDSLPKLTQRKTFIRTADLKFRVKNVAQSTAAIENATQRLGGLITTSDLHSDISRQEKTKFSNDSILVTTAYTVAGDMTIKIPNTQLDTIVKTIAKEVDFLDLRSIKADDVSLQLLSNQLAQNRGRRHEKRLGKAIDSKGKKLDQIVNAEDQLTAKNQAVDDARLENLSLQHKVAYSTLTLKMYQPETIRKDSAINFTVPRPNIGLQLTDSLKSGWYILESLLAFVLQLWSLILIGILLFLLSKKVLRKTKPAL